MSAETIDLINAIQGLPVAMATAGIKAYLVLAGTMLVGYLFIDRI